MNGGTYIRGGLYIFARVFGGLINGEAYIPGGDCTSLYGVLGGFINGGTYIRGGLYIFVRVFGGLINGGACIPGGFIYLPKGF